MPDHIHLLLTPTDTLERAMQLIKESSPTASPPNLPVWQRSFTDHRIRNPATLQCIKIQIGPSDPPFQRKGHLDHVSPATYHNLTTIKARFDCRKNRQKT